MSYKSIINAVGVVVMVAAVVFTGCEGNSGVDPNNPNNPTNPNTGGGGKGNNIDNYKTVMIGTQRWMAENLDNAVAGSVCYDSLSSNCTKYGRLYTWEAAKSACPAGWHLPSDAEWTALTDYVGGASTPGPKLKATSGWNNNGNGTDQYGFAALPGGDGYSGGSFGNAGNYGYWWSATEDNASLAWRRLMNYGSKDVYGGSNNKALLFSVRCVAD